MKIDSKLDPEDIIFDNQEFLKVMNISKRTAQQWRDTGYIGFSQLGNKIYYRLSDIKALLNANYNPKK
jgi:predicted site-specific integrase-resolvase